MSRATLPDETAAPRPRFLADAMLGDVARWLRIMGEDCLYADPTWPDEEVLAAARPEDRVIVTRDVRLSERAVNQSLRVVRVPQTDVEEILVRVYRQVDLVPDPKRAATRCSLCNGTLMETDTKGVVEQALAHGKEPPREEVLERHDAFWSCTDCGQPYWRGTHWDSIEAMRERVTARVQDPRCT